MKCLPACTILQIDTYLPAWWNTINLFYVEIDFYVLWLSESLVLNLATTEVISLILGYFLVLNKHSNPHFSACENTFFTRTMPRRSFQIYCCSWMFLHHRIIKIDETQVKFILRIKFSCFNLELNDHYFDDADVGSK